MNRTSWKSQHDATLHYTMISPWVSSTISRRQNCAAMPVDVHLQQRICRKLPPLAGSEKSAHKH